MYSHSQLNMRASHIHTSTYVTRICALEVIASIEHILCLRSMYTCTGTASKNIPPVLSVHDLNRSTQERLHNYKVRLQSPTLIKTHIPDSNRTAITRRMVDPGTTWNSTSSYTLELPFIYANGVLTLKWRWPRNALLMTHHVHTKWPFKLGFQ